MKFQPRIVARHAGQRIRSGYAVLSPELQVLAGAVAQRPLWGQAQTQHIAAEPIATVNNGGSGIAQRVEYLDAHVLDHPTLASQAPTLLTPRIVQGFRFAIKQLAAHATHQAGMTTAGAAAVGHGDAGSPQAIQQVTGGGGRQATTSRPSPRRPPPPRW